MRASIIFSALLLVCALISGCGGAPTLDGLVPGGGTLTYKGQPVGDATIVFGNAQAGSGRGAQTRSDASGQFSLWTIRPGDGITPGEYSVTVTKTSPVSIPTEAEMEAYEAKHGDSMPIKHKSDIPEKYGRSDTSGIRITIPARGDKNIKLELAD